MGVDPNPFVNIYSCQFLRKYLFSLAFSGVIPCLGISLTTESILLV